MAKICNIGILSVVRKTIGGKGYFLMNEENNDFIKVNQQVVPFKNNDTKSYAMSIDLAKRLNTSINSERKIGTVFYAKQYSDAIGVDIKPSDGQLAILNAEEEADMVEGLAMIADEKKEEEKNIIPSIIKLSDNELSNNALAEQNDNEEKELPFQKVPSPNENKIPEDVYTSDDRDDQGDGSEQDELGYIEEQNDDTKDFIDQNDLSLLSEEDIIINNKINDLLDNGDIIQYCQ